LGNVWQSIRPINIKEGMTFRLFEEDGTPIACEDICSRVAGTSRQN